ncbi:hypothetical protein [Streptomyces sp. 142MFCol3.1]|uniref:hypothetical protein n=1 Tax=Streptomyces sp. 142MFCol3.1 TaxID=1172179 RepID=UPI00131A383C|nr:hypothetical protein [Streptomyces sp. 142MFCol3.1]
MSSAQAVPKGVDSRTAVLAGRGGTVQSQWRTYGDGVHERADALRTELLDVTSSGAKSDN